VGNVAANDATPVAIEPLPMAELECNTADCVTPQLAVVSTTADGGVVVELGSAHDDRFTTTIPTVFSMSYLKCQSDDGSACTIEPRATTMRNGIQYAGRLRITTTAARSHLTWSQCDDAHCIIDGGWLTADAPRPPGP
jgi:hypothetical protein